MATATATHERFRRRGRRRGRRADAAATGGAPLAGGACGEGEVRTRRGAALLARRVGAGAGRMAAQQHDRGDEEDREGEPGDTGSTRCLKAALPLHDRASPVNVDSGERRVRPAPSHPPDQVSET